jgi:hypothetical protein
MPIKEILGLISVLLAVFGFVPYLSNVIRKKIQPHVYSWITWSIVSLLVFSGQWLAGAGWGALSSGVITILAVAITLFSLKNGTKKGSNFDIFLFIIALLSILPWYFIRNPLLSILIAVGIDLLALLPTILKTVKRPKSEASSLYLINVLRQCLVLLSIQSYNLPTVLYPVYSIITNTIMVYLIRIPRLKRHGGFAFLGIKRR